MAEQLAELNSKNIFRTIASNTETVSSSSGVFITITSITIPKGEWLLIGQCQFPSNNGMNAIVVVTDNAYEANTITNATAVRASTGSTDIQKVRYYSATTNTTIYLLGYQNSNNSMNIVGNIRAIKLA